MIYGIIADMHGNLPALQAVLHALDARGVDRIVCLGDIVGFNAEPNECVALIRERGIESIAGNHDLIAIRRLGLGRCADKPAFTLKQTRKDLTRESRDYLATLRERMTLDDDVVLVHGSVTDVREYMTTATRILVNHTRLVAQFPQATLCVFGHTHEPKLYELRDGGVTERPADGVAALEHGVSYFINPGSVDGSRKPSPRSAEFVILDTTARTVEFLSAPYDYDAVEESATRRHYRMGPRDVRYYRMRRLVFRFRDGVYRRINRVIPDLIPMYED